MANGIRLLALLAVGALSGCVAFDEGSPLSPGGRGCTLIGCVNGAKLSVRIATSKETLLASAIEVCRNEQCSVATVTEVPDSASSGAGGALVGPVQASFTVWGAEAGRFLVEVTAMGEGPYPYGLKDGDAYELRVTDASGATLAEANATVTYAEGYPNGKECDRYACRFASHDGGDFTPVAPSDAAGE